MFEIMGLWLMMMCLLVQMLLFTYELSNKKKYLIVIDIQYMYNTVYMYDCIITMENEATLLNQSQAPSTPTVCGKRNAPTDPNLPKCLRKKIYVQKAERKPIEINFSDIEEKDERPNKSPLVAAGLSLLGMSMFTVTGEENTAENQSEAAHSSQGN